MKDDIRVILADNNVQDRESKKRLLNEQGIQVVYETGDGKKALENSDVPPGFSFFSPRWKTLKS